MTKDKKFENVEIGDNKNQQENIKNQPFLYGFL